MRNVTPAVLFALVGALLPGCNRPAPPPPAAAPPPAPAVDLAVTVSSDATATVPADAPLPPAAAPSPAAAPPPVAAPTPADAPPAAPAPAPATAILRGAIAVEPGQRIALAPGAEVVVDPQATFEVELSSRVPDARLLLLDARDDMVPAAGSRELATGTRLTLAPSAPLVPGSRYALRIDGASDRELHDQAGRAFAPLTLPILAAGTPPPPEAKKPPRKKRR